MPYVSKKRTWRPFILVRNNTVYRRLEIGEQRKPDARPRAVRLSQNAIVGQRVIIQKETRSYVERDENVDGVVLVCREDEENRKYVHHPTYCVEHWYSSRCIFSYEKVEKCNDNGVAAEHVIAASPYALQRHSEARPNDKSSFDL